MGFIGIVRPWRYASTHAAARTVVVGKIFAYMHALGFAIVASDPSWYCRHGHLIENSQGTRSSHLRAAWDIFRNSARHGSGSFARFVQSWHFVGGHGTLQTRSVSRADDCISDCQSLELSVAHTAVSGADRMAVDADIFAIERSSGDHHGLASGSLDEGGSIAANPNSITLPEHFTYRDSFREMAHALSPRPANLLALLMSGIRDSRMVLRWLLLGFVLTAAVNAFVPAGVLAHHFGPTLLGLLLTLLATTLLEVCSEGSSPLAAELFHSAHAPGNAFAFLMAGAATDYTEMLSLKSTTGRWICALILPILSVPQVLVLGMLLNQFR